MALGWRKNYFRYQTFFLNIVNLYKQKQDLRIFLEILLSLTTISLFGVFALRPTLLTISQLVKDIKTKEEAVVKMETKIANMETVQLILDQEVNQLNMINASVFDIPLPPVFARQIEGLAAKNSVSVLGMSVDEVTLLGKTFTQKSSKEEKPLPAGAYAMNFSLNTQGSYPNLFSFLKDLEALRLIVKIDSLNISAAKSQTEKILTLAVSGRIPYLGETKNEKD
jgi:Tfp pilus assembly protein PilO